MLKPARRFGRLSSHRRIDFPHAICHTTPIINNYGDSLVIKALTLTFAALLATSTVAVAKHRHSHRYHGTEVHGTLSITITRRHSGACDGFHRCRCGTTAARKHGLPYSYNGYNLKMASEWGRAFPTTSFGIGAVGVKPHHVLTIVGGSSCERPTVYDDAGNYQRNVCGMRFVSVSGGGIERTYSAKSKRRQYAEYPQYATAQAMRETSFQ